MYKLRNITDNIHGTIHISEYECIMTSTPFFYRLHDVYQSSTVYMTFPTNRTKRYEHSLGTMHLAGIMLHAALSNADNDTRTSFLEGIKAESKIFFKCWEKAGANTLFPYINSRESEIVCTKLNKLEKATDALFGQLEIDKSLIKQLSYIGYENKEASQFYLQAVLQALRLAALFHDVGHPPYSHVVEDVFQELKKEVSDTKKYSRNNDKAATLRKILKTYGSGQSAFHENVGKTMTELAFKTALSNLISPSTPTAATIYYTFVAWLTTRILSESSSFTKSLHHFVDGPIDADRLDYIIRDARNSGIDWGRLPYECILNSIKLVKYEKEFEFAFPYKITDTLDEILLNRYKIFSRINSHHRTVKSAKLLQQAIKELSIDYLQNDDCLAPKIAKLWTTLKTSLSPDVNSRKIASWNDSWLMSVLQSALDKLVSKEGKRTPEQEKIFLILEELLLNKKSYYSLLKRGQDARLMANQILQKTELTNHDYNDIDKQTCCNAQSIHAFKRIIEQFKESGNFILWNLIINDDNPDAHLSVFEEVLSQNLNIINDYIVDNNKIRTKTGLPDFRYILLYKNKENTVNEYDTGILQAKIALEQQSILPVNIYVQLANNENPEATLNCIRNKIIDAFATLLKGYYNEITNSKH